MTTATTTLSDPETAQTHIRQAMAFLYQANQHALNPDKAPLYLSALSQAVREIHLAHKTSYPSQEMSLTDECNNILPVNIRIGPDYNLNRLAADQHLLCWAYSKLFNSGLNDPESKLMLALLALAIDPPYPSHSKAKP